MASPDVKILGPTPPAPKSAEVEVSLKMTPSAPRHGPIALRNQKSLTFSEQPGAENLPADPGRRPDRAAFNY